jgi:hypothetical protein
VPRIKKHDVFIRILIQQRGSRKQLNGKKTHMF